MRRMGTFNISRYKKPINIICDLCGENKTLVEVFMFNHTTCLCADCYREVRQEFIDHELKDE